MSLTLRSTTALALSLSLMSGPTWAQTDGAVACDATSPALPCTFDGTLIETEEALIEAFAETGVTLQLETPLVDADANAEAALAAELEAALQAEAEAAAATEAAAAEAAAAEAAASAEAEAAAAEAAATAEADAAAMEAEAAEAAAAEVAAMEAAAAEAAAAEAEAAASAEAEAAASAEAEAAATAEAEAAATAQAEEAALAAELEAAAEAEAAQAAEAEPMVGEGTLETEESLPTETEMPTDPEVAAEEPAGDATGEATLDAQDDPSTSTPEETVVEAPTTAAASDDASAEAEVTTETVAEGDVRTADQDFETAVTGDAAAPAVRNNNNDRGLSNFEKAILLGLGAVAIGSILDNGDEVVSNSGDRIVLQDPNGQFRVLKNDDVLLRQAGSQVETQQFNDGSTRTVVTNQDGTQVITIRAADGRVLRRALVQLDGTQVELFDDTRAETAIDVSTLPRQRALLPATSASASEDELRLALAAELGVDLDRTFSLRQVRNIREVRELAPVIELDTITFRSGSAAIQPDQAGELAMLGRAINNVIDDQPGAVFLVEGHTDAVGNAGYNLALSDRRAETVALALTQYFDVPAVNLITQGYGETNLKVRTLDSEQANRRAVVRNVTRLLQ